MAEPTYAHLKCSHQDGVLVLHITEPQLRSGDFHVVDLLRQELLAAVALNGTRKVVIDLAEVELLGSAGFRPFLSMRKKLQEIGGEMILCGLTPNVKDVFLASRLINEAGSAAAPFGVAPDIASAIKRLNEGTA
jgi:stage II sporulation protein AA (anti-sigma F factor antagonist)